LTFVNRESEIQFLLDRMTSQKTKLIIVYGRHRIGKAELLRESFLKKKVIYFVADLGADQDQCRRFLSRFNDLIIPQHHKVL
jgi:AAA+ ATPase superfamily predicted ATPase